MRSRSLNRVSRLSVLALAMCAAAALALAPVAAGMRLPVRAASDRSARFAQHTCAHDQHCVRHGVSNCRRQSGHVVLCRIFDERRTKVQGRYRCSRLVRVSWDPRTHRLPVTGLGRWHC